MTTAHTYGLLVTVNEWLARQSELIARARAEARREGAKEWEVATESGGVVLTLSRGKV
jgi:hypothetical protein